MSVETPAELAVSLGSALARVGIPYAVGGAVAYGFWGAPRGTQDLDLNLFLPAEGIGPALDALQAAGVELDRAQAERSARERGDVRARYGDMPVDLFVVSIPLHESAARRTVEVSLLGQPIRILSAEDLTLFKLLFFRGKDLVDIERILAVQGEQLDRAYVRRWLIDCVGADDARVRRWDELCAALPPA
ncbi:hypothetical protein KF840_06665 [bacterium]|nr:hypothetical protein [bacterium]